MENNEPLKLTGILESIELIHDDDPMTMAKALEEAILDAVKSAVRNNKAARVSVTLKIVPERDGNVLMQGAITAKDPKPAPLPTRLFTDRRGNLFCEDPRQPSLPMGNVHPINSAKGATEQ